MAVGQESSLGVAVDSSALIGKGFVLLHTLPGSPGQGLLIRDQLQVYVRVLQVLDAMPIVAREGAELAPPSLGSDQLMASQHISDGLLAGCPWEGSRVLGYAPRSDDAPA